MFFSFKKVIYFYFMCRGVCLYACTFANVYLVPDDARRGSSFLGTRTWTVVSYCVVLGRKSRSSGRGTGALNRWETFLAPAIFFFFFSDQSANMLGWI